MPNESAVVVPFPPTLAADPEAREEIRIVIVGHVDHGKSTLIGRLVHEAGGLPDGKLELIQAVSARRGVAFEWSFLLDALQSERDQGITIDTSQIRLKTERRDVVLIDAPGHREFLKNMVTGASQADAALLVVDAAEGVRDQTRRHGYLLHLLGVRQIAVVINKMDKVGHVREAVDAVAADLGPYLTGLGITPVAWIPAVARDGASVATRSPALGWYEGPTVIEALDIFTPSRPASDLPLRLPVQNVIRQGDKRILAGRIEAGRFAVGDEVVSVPSGARARIATIESWPVPPEGKEPRSADAGRSVGITLDDQLFIERGDVIAAPSARPRAASSLRVRLFWLAREALARGAAVTLRIGPADVRATARLVEAAVDPDDLAAVATGRLERHQVAEVVFDLARRVAADTLATNARQARVVVEIDGAIAGGGLVLAIDEPARTASTNVVPVASAIGTGERARRNGHLGAVVWFTGLPGSGKSTLAKALERRIFERGGQALLLDGDTLRAGLNGDLGFSPQDRSENVRRVAEVARLLAENGMLALVALVSPYAADRAKAREIVGDRFVEVFVDAPPEVCKARDPKGHYAKAGSGAIGGFTGVSAPYEAPVNPDLRIATDELDLPAGVGAIERDLTERGILGIGSDDAIAGQEPVI